jgi:hypothetical protein
MLWPAKYLTATGARVETKNITIFYNRKNKSKNAIYTKLFTQPPGPLPTVAIMAFFNLSMKSFSSFN